VSAVRADHRPTPVPPTKATAAGAPAQGTDVLRAKVLEMSQKLGKVNHFELLGIAQSASPDEVGTAFVRAARQFHPDRLVSAGAHDLQPMAERILARINEAAMVLGDARRRAEYVASLASNAPQVETSLPSVLEAENAFLKGEVFLKKGDFAKAIESFTAAIQGNPSEPQYRGYLAWARFEDPRTRKETVVRETLRLMEGVVKDRPRFARGFFWIGQMWKFLNEIDKAEPAFREAVQIDNAFIEASRELRLIEMRKTRSGTSKHGHKSEPPKGGLMGKFFKK
jgi:curved DNA-binding protein CbpA